MCVFVYAFLFHVVKPLECLQFIHSHTSLFIPIFLTLILLSLISEQLSHWLPCLFSSLKKDSITHTLSVVIKFKQFVPSKVCKHLFALKSSSSFHTVQFPYNNGAMAKRERQEIYPLYQSVIWPARRLSGMLAGEDVVATKYGKSNAGKASGRAATERSGVGLI